jgi:tol-pal system protein YbgF
LPAASKGRAAGILGVLAFAVAIGAATLAGPSGASAQSRAGQGDVQALINRIDRLQRELTTLQRQVYRDGAVPGAALSGPAAVGAPGEPNLAAAMQVRLDEIESQMRGFTGKVEELQHAINSVRKRLDKLVSDIDFRLKALEARAAVAGPVASGAPPLGGLTNAAPAPGVAAPRAAPKLSAAPAQPGVLGTIPLRTLERQGAANQGAARVPPPVKKPAKAAPVLPIGTPKAQYQHASNLLFRSDFGGAERAFTAFVAAHPQHRLAGNAQYWLGETHYARGAFRTATAIFAEGYQRYPNSAKAPDNLLKLGMSLAAINKKESACTTFKRLLEEFPKASRSVRSRARAQRKKLRCR